MLLNAFKPRVVFTGKALKALFVITVFLPVLLLAPGARCGFAAQQSSDISGEWFWPGSGTAFTQSGSGVTGHVQLDTDRFQGVMSGNQFVGTWTVYSDPPTIFSCRMTVSWKKGGQWLEGTAVYKLAAAPLTFFRLYNVNVSVKEDTTWEPPEGQSSKPAIFTITRDGDTSIPLSVDYKLEGSADNGTDFAQLSGTAVIPAGETSVDVKIEPMPDGVDDDEETVTLTIIRSGNVSDGGGDYNIGNDKGTITIKVPKVSIAAANDAVEPEKPGEPPGEIGKFVVSRTGDTDWSLDVRYVAGGAATIGADYAISPKPITSPPNVIIPVGKDSENIHIIPNWDKLPENQERLTIKILPWSGYKLAEKSQDEIFICDGGRDDKPKVSIEATENTVSEGGTGAAKFKVTRDGDNALPLTVRLEIGGTAANGTDYERLEEYVVIPVNAGFAEIDVTPVRDTEQEGDERVQDV